MKRRKAQLKKDKQHAANQLIEYEKLLEQQDRERQKEKDDR